MSGRWRAIMFGLGVAIASPQAWPQQGTATDAPAGTRNGQDIYTRFREGLADPVCDDVGSSRWRDHFAATPNRLAAPDSDVLPLFGYVVDALRAAHLPTEYALIPFVESGYKPGARSPGGPAGLWQMIAVTARDHAIPIRAGYDGRLSPVDSTRAAVRYLQTLHGMFAGDWRLAVMAYNAGEYRVFSALRQSHQEARSADPEKLTGMPQMSRAYVRKLHALSCLFDHADDHDEWMQALSRPVPFLQPTPVPAGTRDLQALARLHGWDPGELMRLNPAFANGRIDATASHRDVLAPVARPTPESPFVDTIEPPASTTAAESAPVARAAADAALPRTHRVARGESLQRIARRYKLQVADLLSLNGLASRSVLQPGMVLKLDDTGAK